MTRKIVNTINQDKIIIDLPDYLKNKNKILVILEEIDKSQEQKLMELQEAKNDPLFQKDVSDVIEEFKYIDSEIR